MEPSDAKRLKALEDENGKLKKLLAEQMLDNAMLRDVNSKKMVAPGVKRKAVAHLMEQHQVSQRRACGVLRVDRSTMRYQSRRGDDADLRDAIKRVFRERRRFGYRRIHVMVARDGFEVNHKKLRRIYREEKLQVRRRGGRKRALNEAAGTGEERTTVYTYEDTFNKVISMTDPDGFVMTYKYDAFGEVTKVADPENGERLYSYVRHQIV